jgi:(2Fe-2S) ferredoxin
MIPERRRRVNDDHPAGGSPDRAPAYLNQLREETMSRAWGEDVSPEDRRRIVVAATIFGSQLEERLTQRSPEAGAEELQRFLVALMDGVVEEFAEREEMDKSEAVTFLSEVSTRDYVLEFNEVLEAYAEDDSGRTLDEILQEAVDSRGEKAIWARHWSSG